MRTAAAAATVDADVEPETRRMATTFARRKQKKNVLKVASFLVQMTIAIAFAFAIASLSISFQQLDIITAQEMEMEEKVNLHFKEKRLDDTVVIVNANATESTNHRAAIESTISNTITLEAVPPNSIGSCHNLSWWTTTVSPLLGSSSNNNAVKSLLSHDRPPKTIWVASFPGSGAEMFRKLIEALTGGLPAWSVYTKDNPNQTLSCLEVHAATCKTHWPVLSFKPISFPNQTKTTQQHDNNGVDETSFHSQAIVLLRNPLSAYPSRFNHQWELKHNVGYHVRQAPERAWNNFAKRNFPHQQESYAQFVSTWANLSSSLSSLSSDNTVTNSSSNNSNSHRVALFVPYEGLIDPSQGPFWVRKILKVLHEAGTRHVSDNGDHRNDNDNDSATCLWKDVIFNRPTMKRAPHTYTPGFTKEQSDQLHRMLTNVLEGIHKRVDDSNTNTRDNSHQHESSNTKETRLELISILESYQKSIRDNNSIRIL